MKDDRRERKMMTRSAVPSSDYTPSTTTTRSAVPSSDQTPTTVRHWAKERKTADANGPEGEGEEEEAKVEAEET